MVVEDQRLDLEAVYRCRLCCKYFHASYEEDGWDDREVSWEEAIALALRGVRESVEVECNKCLGI